MIQLKKIILAGLLGLTFIAGWGISYVYHTKSIVIEDKLAQSKAYEYKNCETKSYQIDKLSKTDTYTKEVINNSKTPAYVTEVLEYITEHKQAPEGYVGGRIFKNREGQLPKNAPSGTPLNYQEWDVHPKVEGQNRGAERIVTSSEGDAYFTEDHYKSFIKIK